jgi:nitrite reductase/ring-hydroxylating ferredoxin subunit
MGTGLIELCAASELAPGEMRRFEIAGHDPLLLCNVNGEFRLVEDECTHAIASLSEGRLEGTTVFCPLHGGSFDVCTGKAKSLPCKQALRTFGTAVRGGMVYLMD